MGKPGRGTRMFCPASAIVEIAMSSAQLRPIRGENVCHVTRCQPIPAHLQPEHRMTSSAVMRALGTDT